MAEGMTKNERAAGIVMLALIVLAILIIWLHDKVPPFNIFGSSAAPVPGVTTPNIEVSAGDPPAFYVPTGSTVPAQIYGQNVYGPNPAGISYDYAPYGLNPQNNGAPGICGCGFG